MVPALLQLHRRAILSHAAEVKAEALRSDDTKLSQFCHQNEDLRVDDHGATQLLPREWLRTVDARVSCGNKLPHLAWPTERSQSLVPGASGASELKEQHPQVRAP